MAGRDRIDLTTSGGRHLEALATSVGFDGSVVAEGAVGGDSLGLGGAAVMAVRASAVIRQATEFFEAVWQRIDSRDEVRQLLITCAVPDAQYKVYALEPIGNSMQMPVGLPPVLLAPQAPMLVRRGELQTDATHERLQAELRRAFEVEGAVHPRPDQERHGFF